MLPFLCVAWRSNGACSRNDGRQYLYLKRRVTKGVVFF